MKWVDESRRDAFVRATRRSADGFRKSNELDGLLPQDMTDRSIAIGNERILPYDDALTAITIASSHFIAVLGFEAGEIQEDGFQVVDHSGYDSDIPFTSDWRAYVAAINARSENWIETHNYGHNHGYILTSASEKELAEARRKVEE